TARGRVDAIVELEDKVYCFEFKLNRSAAEALEQIKSKGYIDRYRHSGKKIILVGVNFSTEKREIDEFEVETLL
ncbi:MAG TPA: AAA family ATPase, partial [Phaeodactylibacter sp.]|nr:AAA family ATPase [Phaeodactylibacter sp.]